MALTRTARNVSALPGAIVNSYVAAETLENGQAVYINSSGQAALARANVAATSQARGIVTSVNDEGGATSIAVGNTVSVCMFGPVAGFSDMDEGGIIWLSAATAGAVTQTQPSGASTWSHAMGYAAEIDKFFVQPGVLAPTSNS